MVSISAELDCFGWFDQGDIGCICVDLVVKGDAVLEGSIDEVDAFVASREVACLFGHDDF